MYDQRGRLSSVSSPDPSNDSNLVTIGLTYDARGRRTSLQLPDGSITIVRYAPWQVQVIDADGDFRQQTVDGFGQLREIFEGGSVSADTAHTYYDYDSVGRLDKIVDADVVDAAVKFGEEVSEKRPLPKGRDLKARHPNPDAYFQFARNMVGGMS